MQPTLQVSSTPARFPGRLSTQQSAYDKQWSRESRRLNHKHPAGSFTGPRLCWNLSLTTVLCCFFYAEGSLKFFKNSDVSSTLTVFCVLKRVGYTHPFFPTQSFASVCPVKARRSLSWHSQRHCWLLIYIQRDLLGFPPTVLVMEFGTADFSKVQ